MLKLLEGEGEVVADYGDNPQLVVDAVKLGWAHLEKWEGEPDGLTEEQMIEIIISDDHETRSVTCSLWDSKKPEEGSE